MRHVGRKLHPKTAGRIKRKNRVRKSMGIVFERPRLAVFRSNKHVYAQIIDDDAGKTLVAASTSEKSFGDKTATKEGAKKVGKLLAERALAKSIKTVRFDRGGFLYHGRVQALAEGAREGGLEF